MSDKHWHGFPSLLDAVKALVWAAILLGSIGAGVIAYAVDNLDDRYAPISLVTAVEANGKVARSVQTDVTAIQKSLLRSEVISVKERSCKATPDSKIWFTSELARLVEQYTGLSDGEQPFIPTCEDF